MNKKLVICYLVLLMALPVIAAPPQKSSVGGKATALDTGTYIDVNQIMMLVSNDGAFATDLGGLFGRVDGFYFPYSGVDRINSGQETRTVIYAAGLWMGAVDTVTNDTLICLAEYSEEYGPGPMTADGSFQPDAFENPAYKVYKIYSDSLEDNPNLDYTNWPADQGAPVDDEDKPAILGDQMLWTVYNDADATLHTNNSGKTDPMGLEVQQTTFGFDRTGSLSQIVFIKFKLINKGGRNLKDAYVSLWSDPDLGDAGDDLVGCDTNLSIGYCYNANDDDGTYGSRPPAVGFDFFQGPLVPATPGDTLDDGTPMVAIMWGDSIPGFVNMGMTRFAKYINGTDPQNKTETYNYMQGLLANGSPYMYDGQPTTYYGTGDPVADEGDLDDDAADRRFMVTTGPFDFGPGDSTEIITAIVVGWGANRLNSITLMKQIDASAQRTYEKFFNPPPPPMNPIVSVTELDQRITLLWTDTSEIDQGVAAFEGYTVYQGESPAGPWMMLANYDVINGIMGIADTFYNAALQELVPVLVKEGTDSGIKRYFSTTKDAINSADLYNNTRYYFKVEAYSYDPTRPRGEQTLTSQTIKTVTPHATVLGMQLNNAYSDTLETVHYGPFLSDGSVLPLVVDPYLLKDQSFMVTFGEDTVTGIVYDTSMTITEDTTFNLDTCAIAWDTLGDSVILTLCYDLITYDTSDFAVDTMYDTAITVFWNLFNTTGGTTTPILTRQFNQSGDDDYPYLDGMLLKVEGPPPEVADWDWLPDAALRSVSPVNFGMSGFGGGIGALGEFFGSSAGPDDLVQVEIRWVEDGTGQSAYCYRRDLGYGYDGYHPNQNITVWDVTSEPERQLNFAFVEYFTVGDPDGTNADSVWNPSEQTDSPPPDDTLFNGLGGREYFFVLNSDYSDVEDARYTPDGACFGPPDADFDCLFAGGLHARNDTLFKPVAGEALVIVPYFVNLPIDTFTFSVGQDQGSAEPVLPVLVLR